MNTTDKPLLVLGAGIAGITGLGAFINHWPNSVLSISSATISASHAPR